MEQLKRLKEYASGYGLTLTDAMIADFTQYTQLLLEWNEKVNLTAITQLDEVIVKHYLDSILPLSLIELQPDVSVLDVGAGAGFPSVPMKIVRPDIQLTLLDTLQKRVRFLEILSDELHQDNVLVHARAETLAHDAEWRESFDVVTSRAVAALPALCEYCLPFLHVGGRFLALKGPDIAEELTLSQNAIKLLGAEVECVKEYALPLNQNRTLVVLKKISQTPAKYPRRPDKITKTPL